MDLLKREQRLEQIVRLIGPDALPDEQRLVLVTADLIKTGFLQQSSFDEIDKYCSPGKQVLLLRCIMRFHARAEAAIKAGAPLVKITALPIREKLSRLKSTVPNEKPEELRAAERELEAAFDELEHQYRKEALK
jgi:V/A-type H+-transporting ATPase subunit A